MSSPEQKKLLEITSDIFDWVSRWTTFMNKVAEVSRRSDICELNKRQLEDTAKRLAYLFAKVVDLADTQPAATELINQLIASYDRMTEELAQAYRLLEQILS